MFTGSNRKIRLFTAANRSPLARSRATSTHAGEDTDLLRDPGWIDTTTGVRPDRDWRLQRYP